MAKKQYKIAEEVRNEILRRIREEGITVAQAAKDHGVSDATIYNWLGKSAKMGPTWSEHNKTKKENQALKELVGELTLGMNISQKKN